jgi:CMP-N-acetylneuraminic acid synthetase
VFNNTWFIIPARKDSRGFPCKNRKLCSYAFDQIPWYFAKRVIVTSDDDFILNEAHMRKMNILQRSGELSQDETSMKDVVQDVIKQKNIDKNDIVVVLYMTYPERTYDNITHIYSLFVNSSAKSLLCRKKTKTHPYMTLYKEKGGKARQVVEHELYRRQEYPECFELSHFICIFKTSEVKKLNNQLYNKDTIFHPIDDIIDVDTENDFERFLKNDGQKDN